MSYLTARPPGAASMQQVVDRVADGEWEPAHRMVRAEVETAAALEQLGADWRVLHCLPVGPGPATLAHLVIGPQGLFAITSLPHQATVVDVVDGHARLSAYGIDDALAEVRQRAQRVLVALRQQLGRAVDIPAVRPVLCMTGGGDPVPPQGGHADVVGLHRLVSRLRAHPRQLSAAWVQRLAAVAEEPLTWDAPETECFTAGLQDAYDGVVLSTGDRSAAPTGRDGSVVPGEVTASQPPQGPAESRGLRTASVLMIVLGMASLGTLGLLSAPSLAFGALTLRHHGGWRWLNDKDAALFLVGMTMAGLPLLLWVFFSPLLISAVA